MSNILVDIIFVILNWIVKRCNGMCTDGKTVSKQFVYWWTENLPWALT